MARITTSIIEKKQAINATIKADEKININLANKAVVVYPNLESLEITPTVIEQDIEAQKGHGYNKIKVNAVTSEIDENIIAENIKKDVTILGVTGNVVGYEPPTIENETLIFLNNASVEGSDLML